MGGGGGGSECVCVCVGVWIVELQNKPVVGEAEHFLRAKAC